MMKENTLPEDWEIKKLGEVCDIQNGYAFKAKDYIDNGKIRVIRIGNVQKGYIGDKSPCFVSNEYFTKFNNYSINENDILISLTGDVGRVGSFPKDLLPGLLNQRVGRFVNIDNNIVNTRYLFNYLNTNFFEQEVIKNSSGVAQKNSSTKKIKELPIPLPTLQEQKRIVKILDKVFENLEESKNIAEENLKNAKDLFDSYLENIFEEKGEDWEDGKLENICKIKHGYAFKSKYFSTNGSYVLLTPGNFYETGGYKDRKDKQKYFIGDIPQDYILSKNNLLLAMTEQAAGLLGSPILVPDDDKFLHNQRLGLVIPNQETQFFNKFFYYYFNTKYVRNELHNTGTGIKVRHTSPTKIGDLRVVFPKDIEKQKEIVGILDSLSDEVKTLEKVYKEKSEKLEELNKSILERAFAGEL